MTTHKEYRIIENLLHMTTTILNKKRGAFIAPLIISKLSSRN